MADTYHGWRDGRRGLPRVHLESAQGGSDESAAELVETARVRELRRRADLQVGGEWLTHQRETTILTAWFTGGVTRLAAAGRLMEQAGLRLDEAARPPEASALDERRTAEHDTVARPPALVRARRRNDHLQRMRAAETAFLNSQQNFATALVECVALADLVHRRTEVTRIRVRRIQDYGCRRTAAYWRKLVRVHRGGAEINARLGRFAPELPEWARDDDPDHLEPGTDGP